MNILLLIIFCGGLAILGYKTSTLKLLSPTFLSAMMFLAFSIIYLVTFSFIKEDIKFKTTLCISLSIVMTYIGEIIADKIRFKVTSNAKGKTVCHNKIDHSEYVPSFAMTCIITGIMLLVALIRFINLRFFASQYGSFDSFMSMMTVARVAVNQGEEFNLGGGIIAQIVYASTGICFFYTYNFLKEFIVYSKKRYYLLLPILADCLIELSTTGRTSIIIIAVGFIVSYFHILIKYSSKHKPHINKKLYFYILIFLIIFFVYGNMRTGYDLNEIVNSIIVSIISYSCAAIYGLNYYLENPWNSNPYFAAYTGKFIYSLLGIEHTYVPDANLPFFFFGEDVSSNIYTSLVLPIQDYGIVFFLITRVGLAIISTYVLKKYLKKDISQPSFYIYNLLAIFIVNCYINTPIADRFYTFFLNPILLIRYIVYLYVFVWIVTKIKFKLR